MRALRKRKPQETQALALASSQSWLPLLRPSIPIGWRLRLLREIFTKQTQVPANKNARSKQLAFLAVFVYATHATQSKRLRLNGNRALLCSCREWEKHDQRSAGRRCRRRIKGMHLSVHLSVYQTALRVAHLHRDKDVVVVSFDSCKVVTGDWRDRFVMWFSYANHRPHYWVGFNVPPNTL